jgi:hypothetical protein
MIFLQHDQITGQKQPRKTQTRRLVKETHFLVTNWDDAGNSAVLEITGYGKYRAKWAVGKTYAVQSGRGKKAIGRTPPIQSIRRERLGDISGEDCLAEGIGTFVLSSLIGPDYEILYFTCPICECRRIDPQDAYACLWNHTGGDWEEDRGEDCWVLDWGEK